MKRTLFALVALAAIFAVSCNTVNTGNPTGSSPKSGSSSGTIERKVPGAFPQFVKDAIKNQPEDALIGVGVANLASLSQSMIQSTNRARADISRQMSTMVQDMIRDYQASSEVDRNAALSFQENITVSLSKAELKGATVVDQDQDDKGNVWTVVMLSKSSTVEQINQAVAAQKLAAPAMASFNAEERMNAAFDKAYGTELIANDR